MMHIGDPQSFKARGACVLELEMRFGRINSRFRQKVTFWALFRSFWRRVTFLDPTKKKERRFTRHSGHPRSFKARGAWVWK